MGRWPEVAFRSFLRPNARPYLLADDEDANLVGMRLYGGGAFHRELKPAMSIAKKSHFVIRAGDVIYNKLFAWKGTFGLVPRKLDGMFVSDKFPTYALDRELVDERYLSWYFRHPPLWEQAQSMSTGSAALSKLTLNPPRFLELTIPLPPLPEQRRVVARIQEVAELVEKAQTLRDDVSAASRAALAARLRALASNIQTQGLLGDVLSAPPRNGWSARCDGDSQGVPVLSLSAVTGFQYRPEAFKRTSLPTSASAHYWLREGDLLMTRSNTPELVGHASIYGGSPAPCIYPDLVMRLEVDRARADTRFVWYWLQAPQVRQFVVENAKGTSPTMKKISQATVMAIPFPAKLDVASQRAIVSSLDRAERQLDSLARLQSESSAALDALLPAVLDRAFRGEL